MGNMFKKANIEVKKKDTGDNIELWLVLTIPKDVFVTKPTEPSKAAGVEPAPAVTTPKWICSQCNNSIEVKGIAEPVVCNHCGATTGFKKV